MAVTAKNLIQGPATLYVGLFGATEPTTVTTAPASPAWRDLGGTKDGVSWMVEDTFSVLSVDQIVEEVGRVRTERKTSIKTSLAEGTLDNLRVALNEADAVSQTFEPSTGTALFLPPYRAVLLDGIAPGGTRRRVIGRKVLSVDSIESSYKKDGQLLVPVNFALHYVSASIRPFKVEDEPSA